MFSHVVLAASDFKRAYAFYAPLMQALDIKQRFYVPENSWAGWQLHGWLAVWVKMFGCRAARHSYGSAYRPTQRTPSALTSKTSALTGHAVACRAASTIGA